jgi:hypothetical protein
MHCPNCGITAPLDQKFCRSCGLSLPEFSQLLEEKLPTEEEVQVKRRKAERWSLRLWTIAGAILYIALYWAIISEIIIGKGHVLGGVLFLLVITVISIGGLLMLYSLSLNKRSAYGLSDQPQVRDTSPESLAEAPAELKVSVTEHTTEILDKDDSNK